jgi:5,10-methylenetetrahydromethanopterin reductase
MEVWLHTFSFAGRMAPLARRVEDRGYTGLLIADSQTLNADVWVELALAAAATQRIRLGPGVTNPVTRHPSVTASAAATLQEESGGRAVLGLGRGDTAVTRIGRRPVPVGEFERTLAEIQSYLRGEEIDDGSTIGWVAESAAPKVPVTVAATGPRVIAAAARHAEAIDLTVGAARERLRPAVETAREAAGARSLSVGAYVNVAVHPDVAAARDLVRANAAMLAAFGGDAASGDEFVDRFAVCGPAELVLHRLSALAELGIERVIVVPGSLDADPAAVAESNERFAAEVLPGLLEV